MDERRIEEPAVARADGPGDVSDDEFEFSVGSWEPAAADELFANGRVRAFYPVFGRVFDEPHAQSVPGRRPLGRLFREESRNSSVGSTSSSSSSSSAAADLDGVPPDSYCVWTPGASPASSPRKSGSTGSLPRWRLVSLSQLGRSHSESRDKLGFLSAPPSPAREQPKGKPRGRNSKATTELDTVASSHRLFYGAKASPGAAWRTFLPYRQDLVGLFSTPKGLSRTQPRREGPVSKGEISRLKLKFRTFDPGATSCS